jgi:hypothetical protein
MLVASINRCRDQLALKFSSTAQTCVKTTILLGKLAVLTDPNNSSLSQVRVYRLIPFQKGQSLRPQAM